MDLTQDLGFQLLPQIIFPFPYGACNFAQRTVNGITCTYSDPDGVPYTKIQRLWFELIVTEAIRTQNPIIIFGKVSEALNKTGQDRSGRYIKSAKNAIIQISKLSISTSRDTTIKSMKGIQGLNLIVGRKYQLLWANGVSNENEVDLFEDQNYMELSADMFELTKYAIPHNREHYAEIQSTRTQDLYTWVILKLFNLKEKILVPWEPIYAQFGKGNVIRTRFQEKYLRDEIKSGLLEIKTKYYPQANIETTDEGVIFKPSPSLIERGDKKAGYTL